MAHSAAPGGGEISVARFAPERFVLPNGLVVLHQANPTSPAVSISLRIAAGACLETPETAGLASFCGGMLKRGTTRRSKQEIVARLETYPLEKEIAASACLNRAMRLSS